LSDEGLGTHTWLIISDGSVEGTKKYSFGPIKDAVGPIKDDDGNILVGIAGSFDSSLTDVDDSERREQLVTAYTGYMTDSQYDAMLEKGDELVVNPPQYEVFQWGGNNCVEVTSLILEAGGIDIAKGYVIPGNFTDEVLAPINQLANSEDLFIDPDVYQEYMKNVLEKSFTAKGIFITDSMDSLISSAADSTTKRYFDNLETQGLLIEYKKTLEKCNSLKIPK